MVTRPREVVVVVVVVGNVAAFWSRLAFSLPSVGWGRRGRAFIVTRTRMARDA